jgi:hypothetical protein
MNPYGKVENVLTLVLAAMNVSLVADVGVSFQHLSASHFFLHPHLQRGYLSS